MAPTMAETTFTLAINGEVPLDKFAEAIRDLWRLVNALTQEVSGKSDIAWFIDELAGGSAITTIRGEAEQTEDVERVVHAYAVVGRALERNEVIPYSPRVAKAARSLTSLLNGNITSMTFETEAVASTVTTGSPDQSRAYLSAFGAVEGRIETLRSRRRLSFTLYDSLNDQAVYCSLRQEQAELVRDAWGRRVIVEGWVKREPTTGRPVEINAVEGIHILPELEPGQYRRARAIAPASPNAPSTEEVIRRMRDA
jgi:hypothetical protein